MIRKNIYPHLIPFAKIAVRQLVIVTYAIVISGLPRLVICGNGDAPLPVWVLWMRWCVKEPFRSIRHRGIIADELFVLRVLDIEANVYVEWKTSPAVVETYRTVKGETVKV